METQHVSVISTNVAVLVTTRIYYDRPAERFWDADDNFRFLRKALSGDRVDQTGMNGRGTVLFVYAKANDLTSHDPDSRISTHVLLTNQNTTLKTAAIVLAVQMLTSFLQQTKKASCNFWP